HRRTEYDAVEPRIVRYRVAGEDVAAHRVCECIVWRRAMRQDHLLHEDSKIALEFLEVSDVALAAVGQHSARAALPTPIMYGDGEATPPQIGDDLEVLLDVFATAGEDAHRAASRSA